MVPTGLIDDAWRGASSTIRLIVASAAWPSGPGMSRSLSSTCRTRVAGATRHPTSNSFTELKSAELTSLTQRGYDDGFIAYLNLAWESSRDARRQPAGTRATDNHWTSMPSSSRRSTLGVARPFSQRQYPGIRTQRRPDQPGLPDLRWSWCRQGGRGLKPACLRPPFAIPMR